MCTREEKKSIMNIINFYKARLNNYQDELLKHDIKKVIKEANDKRDKLNEKLRYIDVLKMKEDYDGIYKKDEMDELEQMILKTKSVVRRNQFSTFLRSVKRVSPKNIILEIKYRKLKKKYLDFDREQSIN